MISTNIFLDLCLKKGFDLFSGTPCSYLKPLINAVIDHPEIDYLQATNEGDAVAMVCGASLMKRKGIVMFQNSGLGNAVNPLTSLAYPFRFPFLLIVTHRGQPGGPTDEPQHELMGKITEEMLSVLQIPWEIFPDTAEALAPAMERALQHMNRSNLPYAFIMRKGTMEPQELKTKKSETPIGHRTVKFEESLSKKYSERASRTEALAEILKYRQPNDIIVATTGKSGREIYTLDDASSHIYLVGSMGCASSFALGAALNSADHRWIVIDGDAAALMRLGNLATIGLYQPENLLHVVLDNEVNDSTGGQTTASSSVAFAGVAISSNYKAAYSTDEIEELSSILEAVKSKKGPTLVHFRIKKGSPKELGRPKIKPPQVKERLINHLHQSAT
jgi:phosphonopyruvate decarboxylase